MYILYDTCMCVCVYIEHMFMYIPRCACTYMHARMLTPKVTCYAYIHTYIHTDCCSYCAFIKKS